MPRLRIWNQTRNTQLADRANIADSSETRRTGLLKHSSLAPGEGLWIAPCEAVHTIGMNFAIDVLYLDKKKRILKIRDSMPKWRMSACLRAHSVLELPAGMSRETQTKVGDQLEFTKYDV